MSASLLPFVWFILILCLIPAVLWLLKRTPLGGSAASGVMRLVAQLPVSPISACSPSRWARAMTAAGWCWA